MSSPRSPGDHSRDRPRDRRPRIWHRRTDRRAAARDRPWLPDDVAGRVARRAIAVDPHLRLRPGRAALAIGGSGPRQWRLGPDRAGPDALRTLGARGAGPRERPGAPAGREGVSILTTRLRTR